MLTCASCGGENSDQARFCQHCGSPLAAPAPAREERRTVSILFADIVGFTTRSDQADPEDVRRTLLPFHSLAKEEIERFGGTLDKFIGDAAMGVFGVPSVHEDDAERAVRAGLAIQRRGGELEFGVRVAVETGEAVVTLATGPQIGENVAGDVVNTASRLQSVAPPGGVVVGEGTHGLTEHAVDYQSLDAVEVKGKARPLSVWLATGVRTMPGTRAARGTAAIQRPPFVGRDHELRRLTDAFARVEDHRSVGTVVLLGEPGIGKSRLLDELANRLEPELRWRRGTCPPYGEGVTFWAFGEILRSHLEATESDPPERILNRLEEAIAPVAADDADRKWLTAQLAPVATPASTDVAASRDELFAASERFLRSAAERGPLVLVFEDLHWAEEPMNALVEHLAASLGGAPVLILGTARPEFLDARPEWADAAANVLRLQSLSEGDMRSLVSGLDARGEIPEETERALIDRAGGNPLFAREFVRMMGEQGEEAAAVPDSLQAVVAARLDRLPSEERSLVQTASVIGSSFWPGALEAADGATDADAVLASLASRGLVREIPPTLGAQKEFTFTHGLIREVAYGQMPRRARADKHARAAAWIEHATPDAATERAELLAHHYSAAVRLTKDAGGSPDPALEDSAWRSLLTAAERAFHLDGARSFEYYRAALELMPQGHLHRPATLARAARVGRRAGQAPQAEITRMYEEALEGFVAQGDRAAAGETGVRLSMQLAVRGEVDRSRAALREAVELLEQEPEAGRQRALAYATVGEDAALNGKGEEALEWSERALAVADAGEEVTIMALHIRGDARCSLGDLGGTDDLREALRMSSDAGFGMDTFLSHSYLGEWLWLIEGPARGLEENAKALELGLRRGLAALTPWGKSERMPMLFDMGEWDQVLRLAGEVLEGSGEDAHVKAFAMTNRALVLARRGRAEEAMATQDELLAEARRAEDLQVLAPALATAALVALAADRTYQAMALAEEFEAASRDRSPVYREVQGLEVVRVCAGAGALELAERILDSPPGASTRSRLSRRTAEAVMAEANAKRDEAAAAYTEAEASWRDYGHRLETGLAALGAGRCTGDQAAVERARRIFESLAAEPLLAEADRLLST